MLRILVSLLTCTLCVAYSTSGAAAQAAVPAADACLAQLRGGQSPLVECYAQFETDAAVREELSRNTFDMVKSARCEGTIRVLRAALLDAIIRNDVLELDPQAVTCSITTKGDAQSQVDVTLAPQVQFQAGRIADISPRLISISNLPEFLVAPLRSAAESEFIREQLTNGLNAYLDQALGR